jgi:hypothetical protein
MSRDGSQRAMARPPEGAIVGEDVPKENELEEYERTMIDENVSRLKSHPRFNGWDENEIREKVIEQMQKKGVIK